MNAPTRLPAGPATPARARFVHLKVHSAYSLLEGALPIGKLAKLAAAHSFPAVGLTDTNNLYGALEFSDKLADTGIQPIVGVTLTVDFEDRRSERDIARRAGDAPARRRQHRAAGHGRGRLRQPHEARFAARISTPPTSRRRTRRRRSWPRTPTA